MATPRASDSIGPEALRSLSDIEFLQELAALSYRQASGTLVAVRGEGTLELQTHAGSVVRAFSSKAEHRLGRVLIDSGALTEEKLLPSLVRQRKSSRRLSLGRCLLEADALGKEALTEGLMAQARAVVEELLEWWGGPGLWAVNREVVVPPSDALPRGDVPLEPLLAVAVGRR